MMQTIPRGGCCENGINPKAVYDFIQQGERENLGINAFMLIKNKTVVAEGYYAPYNNSDPHVLYSMSKSITATALGFAIEEGRISLEDSVSKFFPEYDKHGRNQKVTVRHLVTMTAGKMVGMAKTRHKRDWVKIFFDAPFVFQPGKSFIYINDNFYMLSAIISKVYGETLVDFLYPRLFAPLGIPKPVWETDLNGYAAGGWGLYMPIEDLAKIMICYSENGVYDGKQIIPRAWIEQATVYQVPTLKRGQVDVTQGYGYGFWQTTVPHSYRAYGLHGQIAHVFTDKDTALIVYSGISKDEYLSLAVDKMCETLWDTPDEAYEPLLKELLASLGDKDDLPAAERNTYLEKKYNQKALMTRSTMFASMLNATISTMFDEHIGYTDRFIFNLDKDGSLHMLWKESSFVNEIKLGMDNHYVENKVNIGGIQYTACTKAAWIKKDVLRVLVRIKEVCHVRQLDFDFSDEKHIVVHNDSFPDLPNLAVHYLDFAGFPLPVPLENLLKKYVAPMVLGIGEPDFKIR